MGRLDELGPARGALTTGGAVAVVVVVAWVALTAATGKTYHLAPLLAALAPGVFARAMLGRLGWAVGLVAGLLGFAIALGGWGIIVSLDERPSALLFDGQPGGVFGEVLGGALVGGAIALFAHIRSRTQGATTPRS